MKRITVEMVKEAYAKTGLRPGKCFFRSGDCACAIGVCVTAAGGNDGENYFAQAERLLGVSFDYCSGFVRGFDGKHFASSSKSHKQGHRDGLAVAAAIFGEG